MKLDKDKPIRQTEKGAKAYTFYDATKEVPTVNPTEENNKRDNIYYWGKDNLYPNYLASLYYNCAIHNGLLRQKVHYTVSGGLGYKGSKLGEFALFYKNGNSDYNLDEIEELLSQDLEVYNGYCFVINFVNGLPFQIDHIDFEQARKTVDDCEYDYYISEDWSDKKAPVRKYKELDTSDLTGSRIVYYKEKPKQIKLGRKLTKGIYPAPAYSGGILAIETDIEINNYRRNEIHNNFSLGTVINFNNGQPAEEDDREEIIADLAAASSGSSNAGGIFATFNNGKDRETTVTNLTGNNLDQRYMALSKDNKDNILLAHSVTNPMLFGIKTEGQLGGSTELNISYALMKAGYFKYRQRALITPLQYIWTTLLGYEGEIFFNPVDLDLPEEEKTVSNTFNFAKNSKKGIDPVVHIFGQTGRKKTKKLRILDFGEADFKKSEKSIIKNYAKFDKVTDMQVNVLGLLHEGNDFDTIQKNINVPASKLSEMIKNLRSEGYLKGLKATDSGIRLLASNDKVTLSIVYSYELRPDAPPLRPGGESRDFCQQMIELNRVYTRGEIEQVGVAAKGSGLVENADVWLYRGGWYHNPETGKNSPSCRHYWQQNIILD